MKRRGVGIAGLSKNKTQAEKYKEIGQEISEVQVEQMTAQFDLFKKNLEEFATKYRTQIRQNPEFRRHFNELCLKIGVDPLASNKGFWAELLGVGDFYYELAVQIVEVCLTSRSLNGGLMDCDDVLARLQESRGSAAKAISKDDVDRAVKKLKILGDGFEVVRVGSRMMIQSLPRELSSDHTTVLLFAQDLGFVTASQLHADLKWPQQRIHQVLTSLLQEGIAWTDEAEAEVQYWFPTMFFGKGK